MTNRETQSAAPAQLVRIEKPIYGGAFLARLEGKAVFVPLTLPGEAVRARIGEDRRGYATAEAEEIVEAAPERIAPACAHFGACGGCHYQHTNYPQQLEFKRAILRETLERGGVSAPAEIAVLAGEPWQYRNRIRLAFDAEGRVGYRGRRSHAVVPIAECPIAAPALVEAALVAAEVLRSVAPQLRPTEIALFANRDETALQASLFVRSAAKRPIDALASALSERLPRLIGAEVVVESAPPGRRPAPPPRTAARWGEDAIVYRAAGFDYRVDHGAFFQVNRWLVDGLVERVTEGQRGKVAWDLFAGVGLFARKLSESFERVVAVESAPAATGALAANLKGTGGIPIKAATAGFLQREGKNERPDLIVVDPPRTGLGAEITSALSRIGAPSMVYVSCDPATLARDLKALTGGGYAIESVAMADLFPQTFHLETLVRLRRA
jgi:23S rRNA (uracil1939-C5)-methyltransferase